MTDFKNDNLDKNLQSFLKKHQPNPPVMSNSAEVQEYNKVLNRIKPASTKTKNPWFIFGSAMAAGLLALWFLVGQINVDRIEQPVLVAKAEVAATVDEDDDMDLFMEEWPTLEVGEEYLTLASF